MKRVWVMRHAKAESDDAIADIERPLAKRGAREAPEIGLWLAAHGGPPDLVASSPALRARQTADLVARGAGYRRKIASWPLLYPGEAASTLAAVRELDDSLASVLLVTHNPHAEDLVALLAGGLRVRMATSALALLETEADSWGAVEAFSMSLSALVSPATL